MVRNPSFAIVSRTSSAIKFIKLTTASAPPANFSRRRGSWVAIPTGQVFLWQTLIIKHPRVTKGAVAKPNSSAPSKQAMATSRPVFNCPSVSKTTRLRKSFNKRVWFVSATPNSHGAPACCMEDRGEAPVPPS